MIMATETLLALYDREQRREIRFANTEREETAHVVRVIDHANRRGAVLYSWLDESSADDVIEQELAYWRGRGYAVEWKLYGHDRPADLKERLAARGFQIGEAEAIMVLSLDEAPPTLWAAPTEKIVRVEEPAQVPAALAVQEDPLDGANHAEFVATIMAELSQSPEELSVYAVVAEDGQIAASAWIRFPQNTQFASLWGGNTRPAFRGRGFYRSLLAIRAAEARQRGFRFLTLDASPMSRPIVERLGFRLIAWSYPCEGPGSDTGVRS